MKMYPDLAVMVLTTILTLFMGVIEGIVIGIALGLLLALLRTAFPNMPELGKVPGTDLFRCVGSCLLSNLLTRFFTSNVAITVQRCKEV
jgi:MFS superfamily sulfate permease-like transporter